MPGSLGGLVVSLGLNAAEFFSGMTKAEREAAKFAQSMERAITAGVLKAEIAFKALSEAASFAIRTIPDLIDQAGHFQDLAEKTGATAESLASFAIAAKVAGTSMDDLATFSIKLSKNLSTANEDTSKLAAALDVLQIPIKEFKALDPAEQMERLAKALAKFSDVGGGKAAAMEAIAKGGAQLLPFLKELEESGGRQIILTNEQIKRADEFSDAQKRAAATLNVYAQALATEFAPAISGVTKAIKEVIEEMLGLNAGAKGLPTEDVRNFAESAALALAHLVDTVRGVGVAWDLMQEIINRTGFGSASKSLETLGEDLDKILQRMTFAERVRRQFAQQRSDEAARAVGPPAPEKPRLRFNFDETAAAKAERARKLILDQALKNLDLSIASEQDTLNARESFLRLYYQADLIGLRDFYQGRRDARAEALTKETAALNEEIAILQAFAAKAKPEARIQAETKLADVIAKRNKLQQQAAESGAAAFIEEAEAIRKLSDAVTQAGTALKALQGDTVGAGLEAFDRAHQKLLSDLQLLQKSPIATDQALAATGIAAIEQTRALTDQRLRLDKATKDYSLTLDELGIAQQRIDIAQQTGDLTTLGGLQAKSELAAKYTVILKEQLAVAQAVAAESGRRDDIVRVQQLQVALESLAATGDLVAKQFNQIFVGAFTDALSEAIAGTKSLKDAFLDMAKNIERAITRIAAQNIAEKLFGGGSSGGFDFGKILSALFSAAAGGTGGSFGGAGGGGGFGTLSTGTDFWRGGPAVVGESGPEVVNLPRGATVTSNQDSQKLFGPSMNFVINVLPGASTKTAQQAAAMTGIQVQRALARNT